MSNFIDLTGKKFNKLVVIKPTGKSSDGHYEWLCKCDCGNEKIICGNSLKRGNTKSCGCLRRKGNNVKHGHTKNDAGRTRKTYNVWSSIIQRCTNQNDQHWKNYGGRGIIICDRWKKFKNFLDDMGEVPIGLQIDRIDNDGNYCKENCRWTTPKENSRNKRSNYMITFNKKTQCISAWAEETGINKRTIRERLVRGHWSINKALTTPTRG
jgi:hypothetical protein